MDAILRSELLAHRTWPCATESRLGGWLLRAASGFTRRANSALAIGSPGPCLDAALATLASWSLEQGITPCIKITPLAGPDLDAALELRGWSIATPALAMRRGPHAPSLTDSARNSTAGSLRIDDTPTEGWLTHFFAWDGTSTDRAIQHRALFSRMRSPRFASWIDDGNPVALVALVRDGSTVHLYDLVVSPSRRNNGLGRRFLSHLLEHLGSEGVASAYLQVLGTNLPAIALYTGLGFATTHGYHYREAPQEGVLPHTSGC